MAVKEISKGDFESEVLKSSKPVLVDFFATWCGPCKMVSPIIDELSDEHDEFKFFKVNVDKEAELANEYNVMSIPNFVVFKNGEVSNQSVGALPKDAILELFNK